MRYQRCKSFDSGFCYNMGLRNGLNTLACEGYDRCKAYDTDQPLNGSDKTQPESEDKGRKLAGDGRIDIIGQNGNDGEHYMSNNPAECEECGHTLQFDGDSYYCENCINEDKKEFHSVYTIRDPTPWNVEVDEDVVNTPSHYTLK